MTTPDEVNIHALGALDTCIEGVMVTPEMGEILREWLTTGARDPKVLTARYISEKVMEHLIVYIDRTVVIKRQG